MKKTWSKSIIHLYGFQKSKRTYGGRQYQQLASRKFFTKTIPDLLKTKNRLKILDVGAGVGFFTDQIRQQFGGRVVVVSNGLSKPAAIKSRKDFGKKLHDFDLKW